MTGPAPSVSQQVIEAARARGLTVGSAESLTGGSVGASLVEVPGASAVYRGTITAYAVDVKHTVLGVGADILDTPGPVSAEVATAMAHGARRVLSADLAVATTGVAGPEPHGDHAPGTVWIAVATADGDWARCLHCDGGRAHVRERARSAALELAWAVLTDAQSARAWQSGTQLG
ncbi:CinA family protein [Demequina globuliformis]|uniref:CinA family protein n=1 Tax=Demequina globuliformis TaxID=676202 RepID=UPI000782852D|nr:CinA family protein [Demequina globuliformis]